MKLKLTNDIDIAQAKRALEVIKQNTKLFESWNKKDLHKLCDYLRFFTFNKNTPLTKKGEEVDYFGIILTGRALVTSADKVYGYLEKGDMIGYMSFLKMPGNQEHFFDISGEKEGYIATIRIEDFKILTKKEPTISFKLIEQIALKAHSIVYYQFKKELPVKEVFMTPSTLPVKRITDLLESSPGFKPLLAELEQRDKRFFVQAMQLFEFQSSEIVIRKGSRANYLIFVLKGELMAFQENEPAVIYKPGSIVDRRLFFQDLTWQNNLVGRYAGFFARINKDALQDIALTNSQCAINIYSALIRSECIDLKHNYDQEHNKREQVLLEERHKSDQRYQFLNEEEKQQKVLEIENEKMRKQQLQDNVSKIKKQVKFQEEEIKEGKDLENLTDQQKKLKVEKKELQIKQNRELQEQYENDLKKVTANLNQEIDEFLEIDMQKQIDLSKGNAENNTTKTSIMLKSTPDFEVAPLYLHEVHKKYLEEKKDNKIKKKKKNEGVSSFFTEIVEKQQFEKAKKKAEIKMLKKKGLYVEGEEQDKNQQAMEQGEEFIDDYEVLKNEYAILEQKNSELQKEIQAILEENKNLRLQIKDNKQDNLLLQTKVNKTYMQKELLSKEIGTNSNAMNFVSKKLNESKLKFNDVLNEQLKLNRKNKLVTKCAYKWLSFTKQSLNRKRQAANSQKLQ